MAAPTMNPYDEVFDEEEFDDESYIEEEISEDYDEEIEEEETIEEEVDATTYAGDPSPVRYTVCPGENEDPDVKLPDASTDLLLVAA